MKFTIGTYTCEYLPIEPHPEDDFGERNKELFGEPHLFTIIEEGVVIRAESRRIHEHDMEENAKSWVEHIESEKIDWTDFNRAVQLVINKINLFPKKERYLLNDRFTDTLEKWCSVLCYFHPTASGYDINPVCKKFASMYFFSGSIYKTIERQIVDAFIAAHK